MCPGTKLPRVPAAVPSAAATPRPAPAPRPRSAPMSPLPTQAGGLGLGEAERAAPARPWRARGVGCALMESEGPGSVGGGGKGASPRGTGSPRRAIQGLQPPLATHPGLGHEGLWEGSRGRRHTETPALHEACGGRANGSLQTRPTGRGTTCGQGRPGRTDEHHSGREETRVVSGLTPHSSPFWAGSLPVWKRALKGTIPTRWDCPTRV